MLNFSANEICKSKNKTRITVKDVLEAMEKAGFENFRPEIESMLMGKDINILLFFRYRQNRTSQQEKKTRRGCWIR